MMKHFNHNYATGNASHTRNILKMDLVLHVDIQKVTRWRVAIYLMGNLWDAKLIFIHHLVIIIAPLGKRETKLQLIFPYHFPN